jgi:hypothetical protein
MRGIRALPPVEDPDPESAHAGAVATAGGWNPVQGVVFASGSLLVLAGLVLLIHSYLGWNVFEIRVPTAADIQLYIDESDAWNNEQRWNFWKYAVEQGLPPGMTEYQSALYVMGVLERRMMIGGCMIAAGTVIALCSLAFGRRNTAGV